MTYAREYLITVCAFDDDDVVPVCLFAGIKPPDDMPDEDVPHHVTLLMQQIAEEMPEHLAKVYGTLPPPHALFWECAANPVELDAGAEVIPWTP